jgi:hypothetical protein
MMGNRVLQRQVGKKTIKGKIVFVQQLYDGGDMYITTSRRDGKSGGDEMICSFDLDVFEGVFAINHFACPPWFLILRCLVAYAYSDGCDKTYAYSDVCDKVA